MDPAQVYETAVYNRDDGRAFRFVTVPARSFAERGTPKLEALADQLGLDPLLRGDDERGWRRVAPMEAWALPFMLDATMGRWIGPERFREWRFYFDAPNRRGPSQFAQYLTYAPVVPFESSPVGGKALSELIVSAGGGVGAVVGAYMSHEPLLLLGVPLGIILCGAAQGVAEALRIGLRAKLLQAMGVDDPEAGPPDRVA